MGKSAHAKLQPGEDCDGATILMTGWVFRQAAENRGWAQSQFLGDTTGCLYQLVNPSSQAPVLCSENRPVGTRFSCCRVGQWPMFVYVIYAPAAGPRRAFTSRLAQLPPFRLRDPGFRAEPLR